MTGIVLAGGLSSRMGRDKAALPWRGADLLNTILTKLSTVCDELIVVANQTCRIERRNVILVADIIPQCGPLSGIHAGLVYAASPQAFITACDMPHLAPQAVLYLYAQMADLDVVVPGSGDDIEPLFACYAKTCIPVIETLLAENSRKTQELFNLSLIHI